MDSEDTATLAGDFPSEHLKRSNNFLGLEYRDRGPYRNMRCHSRKPFEGIEEVDLVSMYFDLAG